MNIYSRKRRKRDHLRRKERKLLPKAEPKKELKPVVKENYRNYIKTKSWAEISNQIKKQRGVCEITRGRDRLIAHHLKYEGVAGLEDQKGVAKNWILVLNFYVHDIIHKDPFFNDINPMKTKTPLTRPQFLAKLNDPFYRAEMKEVLNKYLVH